MVGVRTVSVQTEGRAPAPAPTTSAPCTIAVQTDPSVEPMEALEQRLAAIEQHIVSRDSSASPATSPVEAESMSPAATNAKAIFRSLDTNGDGSLSENELWDGLADSGLTEMQVEQVFLGMDVDGDGQVTEAEFIACFEQASGRETAPPEAYLRGAKSTNIWTLELECERLYDENSLLQEELNASGQRLAESEEKMEKHDIEMGDEIQRLESLILETEQSHDQRVAELLKVQQEQQRVHREELVRLDQLRQISVLDMEASSREVKRVLEHSARLEEQLMSANTRVAELESAKQEKEQFVQKLGSVLNSGLSQDEEDQLIIQSLTKEIDIDMLNEPPPEPSKTPEVSFEYSSSYKDVVWGKTLLDPLAEQQNPGG